MKYPLTRSVDNQTINITDLPGTRIPSARIARTAELRSNLIYAIFFLFFCNTIFLSYLVIKEKSLPFDDLNSMSIVAVGYAFICIFLIKVFCAINIFSFPIIFALATFAYTLSGFLLYPMDGWRAFWNYAYVDAAGIKQGLPIVLLAFSAYLLGTLLSIMKSKRNYDRNPVSPIKVTLLRRIGFMIYFCSIGLIAFATSQGLGINLSYDDGYAQFSEYLGSNSLPYQMTANYSWFLPWACLILIGTSVTRLQNFITLILLLFAIAIYTIIGSRTTPAILLVLLIPARYLLKHPLKSRQIFVFITIVIVIVTAWDALRLVPVRYWTREQITTSITSDFFGSESNVSTSSRITEIRTPLGPLISNVSNSYQTLMGAIRLVPRVEPFRFGMDYVRSVLLSVPFLVTSLDLSLGEQPTRWITQRLTPGSNTGLGFLQVGEAYINFGALGVIGLYLYLGWFLTRTWYRLDVKMIDPQYLSYSLILMSSFLIWIRNDSSSVVRAIVWGWLIIYLLPNIYSLMRGDQ